MFVKLILLIAMSFLFMSCEKSNLQKKVDAFEVILETYTGQSHSVAKFGYKTVYKNDVTGEFTAYNMNEFIRESMLTYDDYINGTAVEGKDIVRNLKKTSEYIRDGHYEYYDEKTHNWSTSNNGGDRKWVDESYWETYYVGGGYKFQNTSIVSKDLETLAALKEDALESFMTETLKSEFSLSENRAGELAKLTLKYQRMESVRELTKQEKDQFAMKALGVSMNQIEDVLSGKMQGDEEQYQKLLNTAARTNNTTPEQIGRFLDGMMPE